MGTLSDDAPPEVAAVLTLAAAWDGASTPLELAAAARGIERLGSELGPEERAASLAVRCALALARLAMLSAPAVNEPALSAPLAAAAHALAACGWTKDESAAQVDAWFAEGIAWER
ncbi:MAG: hypothetical protein U0324_02650 [Polyangiales bacterium]